MVATWREEGQSPLCPSGTPMAVLDQFYMDAVHSPLNKYQSACALGPQHAQIG